MNQYVGMLTAAAAAGCCDAAAGGGTCAVNAIAELDSVPVPRVPAISRRHMLLLR